jgi:hypothetical protein
MIRWLHTNYFSSNWTPQVRCQEVARRFQKNYDNGMLRRINTGTLKGQPVVCAAIKQSDPCTDSTLLFTLNRNVNPEKALKMLMDRRGLASGNAFVSRGKKTIVRLAWNLIVIFKVLLLNQVIPISKTTAHPNGFIIR